MGDKSLALKNNHVVCQICKHSSHERERLFACCLYICHYHDDTCFDIIHAIGRNTGVDRLTCIFLLLTSFTEQQRKCPRHIYITLLCLFVTSSFTCSAYCLTQMCAYIYNVTKSSDLYVLHLSFERSLDI